jgi:hypothetical protein
MRGHMTEKVDVFAFGVVILEIIAGRPNYCDKLDEDRAYLLEWVRSPMKFISRSNNVEFLFFLCYWEYL